MILTRRSFMAASSLAAASLIHTLPARAAGEPARIGYNGDFWGASIAAITSHKKLWEKHGIDADPKIFTNGPIQVQAFGAKSLEFGYLGPGALWLPASGKAKIIAINTVGFSDRVIAQAGINSIEDLKGKKVGVPEGTSGDMLLRLALGKANMTVDDIELVTMSPSTVVSAFTSKQIAAAGIWYPFVGIIREHLPDIVELTKNSDFFPETTFPSVFIGRNDVVENNPDLVKKVIGAIKEAQDFRAAHLDETLQMTSDLIGIPADQLKTEASYGKRMTSAELAKLTEEGKVDGWLRTLNSFFKQFGRLDNPLDPKDYYVGEMYVSA